MIPETTIVTITIVIFPNIVILPNSTRHILLITLNMNGCNIQIPVLVDNTLILLYQKLHCCKLIFNFIRRKFQWYSRYQ